MTIKKVVLGGLLGFVIGTFVSNLVLIGISLIIGTGSFYSIVPEFGEKMGGELNAYLLQFLLSGLMGAGFGLAGFCFQVERWSITKRTVAHFLLTAGTMIPVAYACYWMEHNAVAVWRYIGIFVGIYLVIWFVQYSVIKRNIKRINQKLQDKKA